MMGYLDQLTINIKKTLIESLVRETYIEELKKKLIKRMKTTSKKSRVNYDG